MNDKKILDNPSLRAPLTAITIAGLTVLSGCAIQPKPIDAMEMQQIGADDRAQFLAEVEKPGAVISLDEAIARALKYNLDHRVKILRQSLAAGELEAGKFDMLPKLMLSAGYATRSEYSARYSAPYTTPNNIDTNLNNVDLSFENEHFTRDLGLSWNLLDFGASYYTAKQNADKLLIAGEHRRKAMHKLIQDVRVAYWEAIAAERLGKRVHQTIADAEQALQESMALAKERVRAVDDSLRFQRNLLENLRLLESVERELANARIRLASLIGLMPGDRFALQEPVADAAVLDVDMMQLESLALAHNTDLREQALNVRITAQNTRKALLQLLPGISFDYGIKHDDDRYLVNNQWNAGSLQVGMNLFNLLSAPARMAASEKAETLAEAQRMALQMSVLTQVHLARHQYDDALRQFKRADQILHVDQQMEQIMRGRSESDMSGSRARIAANVTTILSELRRYQSMAKVQEAIGRLQSSIGMEPTLSSLDDTSLDDLQQTIRAWLTQGLSNSAIAAEADAIAGS